MLLAYSVYTPEIAAICATLREAGVQLTLDVQLEYGPPRLHIPNEAEDDGDCKDDKDAKEGIVGWEPILVYAGRVGRTMPSEPHAAAMAWQCVRLAHSGSLVQLERAPQGALLLGDFDKRTIADRLLVARLHWGVASGEYDLQDYPRLLEYLDQSREREEELTVYDDGRADAQTSCCIS